MNTLNKVALAGAITLGLATSAQAQSPAIPSPANPTPINPVATNGAPLPVRGNFGGGGLLSGRSVFAPAAAVVGSGVDAAGAVVDTSLGTAGAIVNEGGAR